MYPIWIRILLSISDHKNKNLNYSKHIFFRWFRVHNRQRLLPITDSWDGNGYVTSFKIWSRPSIALTFSSQKLKSGSSRCNHPHVSQIRHGAYPRRIQLRSHSSIKISRNSSCHFPRCKYCPICDTLKTVTALSRIPALYLIEMFLSLVTGKGRNKDNWGSLDSNCFILRSLPTWIN